MAVQSAATFDPTAYKAGFAVRSGTRRSSCVAAFASGARQPSLAFVQPATERALIAALAFCLTSGLAVALKPHAVGGRNVSARVASPSKAVWMIAVRSI